MFSDILKVYKEKFRVTKGQENGGGKEAVAAASRLYVSIGAPITTQK
jgi:hypothetical protein